MAGYVPQQPPTIESYQDLADYLFRELLEISRALQVADEVVLQELHVEPERTTVGQIALADGADWNPGFAQGVYFWSGVGWELLGPGPGSVDAALDNVLLGDQAGAAITDGNNNTFVGDAAGAGNTSGDFNTFLGSEAGEANTLGENNVFIGYQTGQANTEGIDNTFVGTRAGTSNTTGANNTFVGRAAGRDNIDANDNVFVGEAAGAANNGVNNTFLGAFAGDLNEDGFNNVFIGNNAGGASISGDRNVLIGESAGELALGNQNIYIGEKCADNGTTGHDNIVIGAGLDLENVGDGQKLILGNLIFGLLGVGKQGVTIPSGGVGIGVRAPTVRLHVDGPVRVKDYATGSLPNAATAGVGTFAYDSTTGRAVVSNGTTWDQLALEP